MSLPGRVEQHEMVVVPPPIYGPGLVYARMDRNPPGIAHFAPDGKHRPDTLIVGEAPSQKGDPTKPITGAIGQRLSKLAGLRNWPFEFGQLFDRCNLLQAWPGPRKGEGSEFDLPGARRVADWLVESTHYRTFVLLGRSVARAFRLDEHEMPFVHVFDDHDLEDCRPVEKAVVIPHPSGLNRWWNDLRNRETARHILGGVVFDEKMNRARRYARAEARR